jgi:hypothetical protein
MLFHTLTDLDSLSEYLFCMVDALSIVRSGFMGDGSHPHVFRVATCLAEIKRRFRRCRFLQPDADGAAVKTAKC